jgi:hypothetical protein
VIGFLRILGVANAAVWFGATLFFMFVVGPAFFSEQMLALLGRPHAGAAAQVVLERYFLMHQVCGGLALIHLVAEWLYMARPLNRLTLWLLFGLLGLGLAGGYAIQPRLQNWHREMYGPASTPARREAAGKSFRSWHGMSQVLNLLVLGGVGLYLWRVVTPPNSYRFRD